MRCIYGLNFRLSSFLNYKILTVKVDVKSEFFRKSWSSKNAKDSTVSAQIRFIRITLLNIDIRENVDSFECTRHEIRSTRNHLLDK